ncbi:hypothetical protein Vadar_022436 [Vaccinium darrowii]|uniref:Uncharacterized protein n=1 Tax=Vaccinium darrowii TaxID=229202 RepID=A0ACB7YFC3_9ERIC|nr:hypothetical protein Vadar_022436 [Vaccinium darrowii]
MKINVFWIIALVAVVVAPRGEVTMAAETVTCDPEELSPCLEAITIGTPPSKDCCDKLTEQMPCLCGYIKDPNFGKFINTPNAEKVQKSCGISLPKC